VKYMIISSFTTQIHWLKKKQPGNAYNKYWSAMWCVKHCIWTLTEILMLSWTYKDVHVYIFIKLYTISNTNTCSKCISNHLYMNNNNNKKTNRNFLNSLGLSLVLLAIYETYKYILYTSTWSAALLINNKFKLQCCNIRKNV